MPTWDEIRQYARSKYNLQNDDEDSFSIVFRFRDDDRTQLVSVSTFTAFDKAWLAYRSTVCKESEMAYKVALRKNDDFAVGALCIDHEGDYIFQYSAPLDTMDPEEFELPLQVVASAADRLERDYSGDDDH